MKITAYISAALCFCTLHPVYASQASPLPSWISGDSNCTIDGRPARMHWAIQDDPQTECDGDSCSTTSGVRTVGRFSDNGGPWVELARISMSNNTMNIRYLGAEPNNWQLTYNSSTQVANGWTTWRGQRYPLSCWKGDTPLPTRCQNYANEAIRHYETAKNLSCGFDPDARWHNNYNNHYGWCMQVGGQPNTLEAEDLARSTAISICRRSRIIPIDRATLPILPRVPMQ
ncbi:DUF6006 family protein [Thiolinea disciformis]|uniref:DUF6006 family protein n=1 Tax=Thiolinea disciformis TaxID=125614 RepID=UPI00036BC779|nr:DUF6006 family protein [Thiolinea disciformis]